MYARETSCPFPIYTDPKGQLFSALGMVKTLSPGEKPAYMRKGMLGGALSSIGQGLRQISNGLALKAGDHRQVGGEFLFEPYDLATPITTPQDEQKNNPSNTNTTPRPPPRPRPSLAQVRRIPAASMVQGRVMQRRRRSAGVTGCGRRGTTRRCRS